MKTALLPCKLITLLWLTLFSFFSARAGNEPIPSGSFIINMGVAPQTYANGLKPWGMIYDLIQNHRVQVKWIIAQNKVKDGADFTYNGVTYRGGTFVIPKQYRSVTVNNRIAYWQSQGVVGATTTSAVTLDVTYTLKYAPRWTFDFQNGKIALNYLLLAGIPNTNYPMKEPSQLNGCDDLFVMPHADPTWDSHKNLLAWTKNTKGWLWYGCHAGSVIENALNPLNASEQMNFLTTAGLVNYGDHKDARAPFNYRYHTDPEMQFIGTVENATTNGSEQVYLPKLGSAWRPGTRVAVWDPAHLDVPVKSAGEAAIIAYGRALGDVNNGKIMFEGGHNLDKGNADAVSAIRAFFNFSFMSIADKEVVPVINGPVSGTTNGLYNYSVSLPSGFNPDNYSYRWTASVEGKFSNPFSRSTSFKPGILSSCEPIRIMITIVDGCGREYYQDIYLSDPCIGLKPPVALDRVADTLTNLAGISPQPVGSKTPLAGTDTDGFVVNYILQSLPAAGQLWYDHDADTKTPDVLINSLSADGLVLNALQMKSLKFVPAANFAGTASFLYTVTDNNGLLAAKPALYQIPVNTPPETYHIVCPPVHSNALLTPVTPLKATDNGKVVSYTIVTVPPATQCKVYLYGVLVSAGDEITPYDATQLKFQPSGSYLGYAEITYSATDELGAMDPTPATLTLQMVNAPPVADEVQASVISNPSTTTQYSIPALSASDPDGSIVSYTITSLPTPAMGTLFYNTSGSSYVPASVNQVLTLTQATKLKFTPAANFSGVATFKYTATDDGGLKDLSLATYSIPVKEILPVTFQITNAAIYSGAGQTTITTLKADMKDALKSIAGYKIVTLPTAGTGTLFYNNNGTYLPVVPNLLLTVTQAATLKFSPQPGYTGTTFFRYTATDSKGLDDPTPSKFFLPVTNLTPKTLEVRGVKLNDTDGPRTIPALQATDADGSIASYTVVSLPAPSTGTLLLSGAPVTVGSILTPAEATQLQFVPVLRNSQSAVFRYTATDNLGLADPLGNKYTIEFNVAPYKKVPKADNKDNPSFNLQMVSRQLVPVSGSDSDGVVTRFIVTKLPSSSQGVLSLQGVPVLTGQEVGLTAADQFSFVPSGSFKGTTSFNYQSMDNDSLVSPEATFKLTLDNTVPVASNILPAEVKKGANGMLPGLLATDTDGSIKNYKIIKLPTKGTMRYDSTGTGVYGLVKVNRNFTPLEMSKFRYTAGSVLGLDSMEYTAIDNLNAVSEPAYYIITIGANTANQVPVVTDITAPALNMKAGITALAPLKAVDVDGTIATYVVETVPPIFYGTLYYNPGTGEAPIYQAEVKMTPAQAATIRFLPSGLYLGDVTFQFRAIDNDGAMNERPAIYTIPLVNTPPVAVAATNPSISSSAGPTFLTPLKGTDDGSIQQFMISLLPKPEQGVLVMDGIPVSLNQVIPAALVERLEFDPQPNFTGNAIFKFTVMDDQGAVSATAAQITIPVTNVAPLADDKISQVITNPLGTGAQVIPALTGTDPDGNISGYLLKSLPVGGKLYRNGTLVSSIPVGGLSISTGDAAKLSFAPNENFTGTASFIYQSKDNSNNFSTNTATYQIPVNLPPVATDLQNTAMAANQMRTPLRAFMASDDGFITSFSITKLPPATDGTLFFNDVAVTDVLQVTGIQPSQINGLSFKPSAAFTGTSLFYTATDNFGIMDVTPAVLNIPFNAAAITLPVHLVSFSGRKVNADDELTWTTANEVSLHHFEVEFSLDGQSFRKLGTVTAKGVEAGNYNFINWQLEAAATYYRLKMVNNDRSFSYSPVVVLKRTATTFTVGNAAPNPFLDKLTISVQAATASVVTVQMTDMSGKLIVTKTVQLREGPNSVQLGQLNRLSTGSYIVVITGDSLQEKRIVIKSK